ncbi:hypothetical protein DTX79_18815, partial [Bacilli bacterium]
MLSIGSCAHARHDLNSGFAFHLRIFRNAWGDATQPVRDGVVAVLRPEGGPCQSTLLAALATGEQLAAQVHPCPGRMR